MFASRLALASILVTVLLATGCGPSPEEAIQKGDQLMTERKFERAADMYGKGLERARKDGATQLSETLDGKLAAALRALIEQARFQAQRHDWAEMLRSIEKAHRWAPKVSDAALTSEVEMLHASRLSALARTARVYKKMSDEVEWANYDTLFDGEDWVREWSEWDAHRATVELKRAAAEVNDHELSKLAADIAEVWTAAMQFRQAQRSRSNSNDTSIVSVVTDIAVAAGNIWTTIEFRQKRQRFERRLADLFARTPFPGAAASVEQPEEQPVALAASQPAVPSRAVRPAKAPVGSPGEAPVLPASTGGEVVPPVVDPDDPTSDLRLTGH